MVTATWKRIFIKCDLQYKNSHKFSGGEEISLKRDTDNFDKRVTRPVNAFVIDSEIIPTGAEILIHHNATHATYEIFDYKEIDGDFLSGTERYFSIPETECFAWRLANGDWNPAPGFELGLRIFKPYSGLLVGLLPKQIKNMLLITSGELCGKAVITKTACDYEIIYQNNNGQEGKLIRLRHYNKPELREEIIAIDNEATSKINLGELLIGLSPTDCKQLKILQDA